jgi:RES domain-containing protein
MAHRADSLNASGFPSRWNSKGKFVIYTAASRTLACLENVVHRSGEGLSANFKVMVINIPDELKIKTISAAKLPKNWYEFQNYIITQRIGDTWLNKSETAILKIPSAIIQLETNYLLNPNHPDFKKIKIKNVEDFIFDPGIK